MEQVTQQINQGTSFQIGTRIVGVLMLLISVVVSISSIYSSHDALVEMSEGCSFFGGLGLLSSVAFFIFGIIVFFIPGLLILLKKRLGWWLAIISSLVAALFIIALSWDNDLLILIILIIPLSFLIILFRDRKNFFKIAS